MTQDYEDIAQSVDADADQMDQDRGAAEKIVLAAAGGDVGAAFETDALDTLRKYKNQDVAGWQRLRERLKKAGVGVTELDKHLCRGEAPQEDDATVADKLIALARSLCNFMHDAQRESYAIFKSAGARQVYGITSSGFSDYLSHSYYTEHDRAPTESSLKVALATLRGQAQFDGEACEVFTRIAKTPSGYWVDLCNDGWDCVEITPTGWRIVNGDAAPLFTRSASMRPLPVPVSGGSLNDLWALVNIPEHDRLMILAWLIECLRPDTPHVVLELVGEQGSVKSTTQKILRRLIDPNQADLRSAPKSVEDVWISARNSHMVSLENLSHLPPQYQDALCVLATGGGYATRTYYTNAEETILELRKPIVLNGISVVVTAQDLLDRCLHIDLPTITNRKLAGDIESDFNEVQAQLLGALLELFTRVLAKLPSIVIAPENRPRMADFAALGEAVFMVNGKEAGEFLTKYNTMRKEGVHRTIDASPVGAGLLAFLNKTPGGWNGTLSDLLNALDPYRPHGEAAWPRTGKGLGDALRRLAPAMRSIGYECKSEGKTGGTIKWNISLAARKLHVPSPASPGDPTAIDPGAVHEGLAGLGFNGFECEKEGMPAEEEIL
jgi:hypothetical protein